MPTWIGGAVIDGLGGSIKFIATAVLFGRHGLWMRDTTGSKALPKFVYFEGGGFENGHGVPVLLEAGAQAQFANTYISADGEHDNVRVGPKLTGGVTFTGCVIRGAGRHGIDVDSARTTVSGCLIGNNGRMAHSDFARQISGVAGNGSGGVRVTTSAAHGWESDDRITVSGNDLNGNHAGAYALTGAQSAQTRVIGNKGVPQIDGWLTARIDGAVADGLHDLANLLYADGQRLRIVRVARKLQAGACQVRLDADGDNAGGRRPARRRRSRRPR